MVRFSLDSLANHPHVTSENQLNIVKKAFNSYFDHKNGLEDQFDLDLNSISLRIQPPRGDDGMSIYLPKNSIRIRPQDIESTIGKVDRFGRFSNLVQTHIGEYVVEHGILNELGHTFSTTTKVGNELLIPLINLNAHKIFTPVLEPTAEFIAIEYLKNNLPENQEKRIAYKTLIANLNSFPNEQWNKNYKKLETAYMNDGLKGLQQEHDKLFVDCLAWNYPLLQDKIPYLKKLKIKGDKLLN
jgi:hypothetical protein